jgi:hypothetical protein
MTDSEILAALRTLTVAAWGDYLRWDPRMRQHQQYLVGRYQGLRDAHSALGGNWRELSDALEVEEEKCSSPNDSSTP